MRMVDVLPSGCWFFTGARSRGKGNRKWYGSFWLAAHGTIRAHKFSAIALGDGFTKGNDLDHTCCFSLCVNPSHLEDVPKVVNQERRRVRRAMMKKAA